jgi:hypothetical protein
MPSRRWHFLIKYFLIYVNKYLSFREGNPFEEETVAASFNFLQGLADEDDKGSDEDEEDGSKKNGEVDNGPNESSLI